METTGQASAQDNLTSGQSEPRPQPAPSTLAVTITDLARGVVVRLEGKADMTTVDRLQFALIRLVARRVPLAVLDLSGLTFLSSLAMGALISLRRDLGRWGGCVKLVAVRPEIQDALQVAGVVDLFEFCATVEQATATV